MGERDEESTAAISIRAGDSFLDLGQYDDARTCYMAAVAAAAKPGTNGCMDYASLGISMNAAAHCFERFKRSERIPRKIPYEHHQPGPRNAESLHHARTHHVRASYVR